MDDFAELGLTAAGPAINNYDKAYDPIKAKAKKLAQNRKQQQDRGRDDQEVDYNRPRRDSRRDYDYDRDRGYYDDYERRDGARAKSAGRDGYGGRGLRDDRRRSDRRDRSSSSESSISPRRAYKHRKSLGEQALAALGLGGILSAEHEKDKDRRSSRERRSDRDREYNQNRSRGYSDDRGRLPAGYLGYNERQGYSGSNAGAVATRNGTYDNQSSITKRSTGDFDNYRGEKRKSESPSSSDSSSVISSSEDDRRQKKMKGKEYITGALAAVATIHAAHGIYASMEARDKRHEQVLKGDMTVEEARRLKNKARLQDTAAIGIAALGIKGAYSEWQEVQEHRQELSKEKQERAKRHEKRLRKASKYGGSSYGGRSDGRYRSEPDLNRGNRNRS
ncbi:MAG: hypothetical protein Q9167_007047 [Letrouitia subvulpina]